MLKKAISFSPWLFSQKRHTVTAHQNGSGVGITDLPRNETRSPPIFINNL